MRDWALLRVRALELVSEGVRSPTKLAKELGVTTSDAVAILHDIESRVPAREVRV